MGRLLPAVADFYCNSCSEPVEEFGDGTCPDPGCAGEPLICNHCKGRGTVRTTDWTVYGGHPVEIDADCEACSC